MIGWLLAGVAAWVALAVGMAVVVGRSITTADECCCPHPDLDDEFDRLPTGGLFL